MNLLTKNKFNILYAAFSLIASSIPSIISSSAWLFIILFLITIGVLVFLQILSARELSQKEENPLIQNDRILKIFYKRKLFSNKQFMKVSFPIGILMGSSSLSVLFYFFAHNPSREDVFLLQYPNGVLSDFWGYIVFNIFPLHYYELFSFFIGIIICIILFYLFSIQQITKFSVGFGFGSAAAIMMLDPSRNDIITTLLYTPLFFYSASFILMQKFKWVKIILPVIVVILHISILLFINAIMPSPNKNIQSLSTNVTVYENGTHEFYYTEPFGSTPSLEVKFNGFAPDSAKLSVIKQDEYHFSIKVESKHFPIDIIYRAQGLKRKNEK